MKKKQFLLACLLAAGLGGFAQTKSPPPPPPPVEPPPPKVEMRKFKPPLVVDADESADFLERNPSVTSLRYSSPDLIVLQLKDKKKEKYNLADKESKTSFREKYGDAPKLLPPPPPNTLPAKSEAAPPKPPKKTEKTVQ